MTLGIKTFLHAFVPQSVSGFPPDILSGAFKDIVREASSAITKDVGVERSFLPQLERRPHFQTGVHDSEQEVQSQGPSPTQHPWARLKAFASALPRCHTVLFFYGGFRKSPHTWWLLRTEAGEDDPSKDALKTVAGTRAPACHPSQPRGRLPPAPALNSEEVESCRKGCINKARDSLTAPVRGRVPSRRWLRAAAGKVAVGTERGRARRRSPGDGAGPLRRPLLQPRRRPAPADLAPGGGRARRACGGGSPPPLRKETQEPATRTPRAKAGAGDGAGRRGRGEALSRAGASRAAEAWDHTTLNPSGTLHPPPH